ncbi:hypothetical protein FACS189483_00410 [Spirochaetia bacterium]|nr:hypothetical protein FACS189483_00410 [Spirochaetia bacterium]
MSLAVKHGYRALFLLTVLLSGCDMFNTPIRPFIDSQSAAESDAKEITAFNITSPAEAAGAITGTAIAVTVPYATDVTNIAPTIAHTGASISPASGAAQNFTTPVTYTVTAADGSTQDYTVIVLPVAPDAKTITGFIITSPVVAVGAITEDAIAVTVPYGTPVTNIAPTIAHTGASISPASGAVQNFTTPVTYTVTAADGSPRSYTVTITHGALTVDITGTLRVGQTLTATPSVPDVTYQWQRSNPLSGAFDTVTDATSSTYLLKGDDLGKYINVKITHTTTLEDITSAETGEVTYGIVVPSSPDLTIKFGMRNLASVTLTGQMVKDAFTSLHQLISAGDDFTAIIRLGDYIDLPELTIDTTRITDQAITVSGADKGRLLRLIVVGINSFTCDSSDAGSVTANNPDAPNHVVFQFQNIPVMYEMNSIPTNDGGYKLSDMRSYITGAFLTGLKTATGLTDSTDNPSDPMLWTPTRKVSHGGVGGSGPDDITTDTLWLPTEWEMFGDRINSSQNYEVDEGQARLEYYAAGSDGDTSRTKYDNENNPHWYWLASPDSGSAFNFCLVDGYGDPDSDTARTLLGGCAPAFCVQ